MFDYHNQLLITQVCSLPREKHHCFSLVLIPQKMVDFDYSTTRSHALSVVDFSTFSFVHSGISMNTLKAEVPAYSGNSYQIGTAAFRTFVIVQEFGTACATVVLADIAPVVIPALHRFTNQGDIGFRVVIRTESVVYDVPTVAQMKTLVLGIHLLQRRDVF